MTALRNIWIVFKRELKSQFNSMLAYVFIATFAVLAMALTFWFDDFFDPLRQDASLEFSFFRWPPWLLMFLAPAVGMRLWAEEHRTGTIELLLTIPIDLMVRRKASCYCNTGTFFTLCLCGIVAIFLAGPGAVVPLIGRKRRRRRRGHCPNCGYLRGPTGGARCPECGEPWGAGSKGG